MDTPLPSLSSSASFVLAVAGLRDPYIYRFADGRWWLRSEGFEFWLFDDAEGTRIIENPF